MASIGGISVIAWGAQSSPRFAGNEVAEHRRPGVNFPDFRKIGLYGKPFSVSASIDYDTAALRGTGKIALYALKGNIVSIVDNDDLTWSGYMVRDMDITSEYRAALSVGGLTAGNYVLTFQAELQKVTASGYTS